MKIINEPPKSQVVINYGYPFILIGIALLGMSIYAFLISDAECIYYFARRGLVKNCEADKTQAYFNSSISAIIGMALVSAGIYNLLKKRRLNNN